MGSLLVLQTWFLEQVVVQGFLSALWLSVAQAGLAGSGAVAARGLKSDLRVHLASQSPTLRKIFLSRGVRRAELEEQLARNGAWFLQSRVLPGEQGEAGRANLRSRGGCCSPPIHSCHWTLPLQHLGSPRRCSAEALLV